jgi:glyoxylase-like metal-dependent hydrolase (beta-lactamase superfamily II)
MRKKILIGVLVALPIVIVLFMRATRGKHDEPVLVKGRLYRVRNSVVDVYGARVGDKVVLFDAGIDSDGPALDALLGALKATRDDVSDVYLTHGHFDHIAMSPLCKKARIHVGAADVEMMALRERMKPLLPFVLSKAFGIGAVEATDRYHDREELPLADGTKLLAVPAPGHTAGSYVLVFDGVLIAGDSIQISDGKLDFASSSFSVDPAANKRSLGALQLPPIEIVCTGHQGCIGDGQKRLEELIAKATNANAS